MNGFDIQEWEYLKTKANHLKISIDVRGDKIHLYIKDEKYLGSFETVKECFAYVCGFQTALEIMKYES